MLTYSPDRPDNPSARTHVRVTDLLYDGIEWFWYGVMPFLVAVLVTEWAAVVGLMIGDAIKGGWT